MLRAIVVLSLILSLSACGTRLNPLNWFGGEREQRVRIDADVPVADIDGRVLVTEIIQLSVEQTTTGAIVRATGVTPSQGYYDAELVEVEPTPNGLVYEFRAASPGGFATAGIQQIVAGVDLSVGDLQGITSITVITQTNQRSVSRR